MKRKSAETVFCKDCARLEAKANHEPLCSYPALLRVAARTCPLVAVEVEGAKNLRLLDRRTQLVIKEEC
jgi:hypothetical protein